MANINSKNRNLIEKVINIVLNILIFIFGIILLISIYTGIQTKLLGNKYTDFFGYSIFEVQTGSMENTISAGDWIITKITQKVKLNDVITYELDGEYITHRIIEVYNGTYITKGDANNAKDDPVDQSQVVGKEVAILANFGILRKTLFNPGVLITLIITLFLFTLAVKKNKEEDAKKGKQENENILMALYETIKEKVKPFINKIRKFIKENKKEKSKQSKITPTASINVSEVSDVEKNDIETERTKRKKEFEQEEELSKTSFFRVVSVNANEVDEKYIEPKLEETLETEEEREEDLDKTSFFRLVAVDADEVDSTLLEIAESKIKDGNQTVDPKAVSAKVEVKEEPKIIEDDSLTKINLSFLKNKKSGQNIIETAIFIKKEELLELLEVIIDNDKVRPNESSIRNIFINNYIDAKYYNYFEESESGSSTKSMMHRIEKVINKVMDDLIANYQGNNNKYNDLVNLYGDTFILIANLEKAKDSIDDAKVRNEFYKKVISKYDKNLDENKVDVISNELNTIQKKYSDILAAFLKKLETTMFNLNVNKLSSVKNMFGLQLEHNIAFSKVYSDYVIDRTYAEGIVAEDKMAVLINLLLVQLIKDMTTYTFNKKYVLYIPESLYLKEKKLEKLLRMIDDKYAKDNTIILVSYEELIKNKQIIKGVRKMGYKFAISFNSNSLVKEKDRGNIYIADYIFINKKAENTANIISLIPEELKDKVVYENIVDKVGDFGSEKL